MPAEIEVFIEPSVAMSTGQMRITVGKLRREIWMSDRDAEIARIYERVEVVSLDATNVPMLEI